ncbi:MAG TPA: ribosome biogenesis GTP-binding protein YihA/YsxC [Terriglobales bacterium]|nr:ribosome biogenesis GTP-binding protein YihA/YsxC [Terriglobales bacterium]
MRVSAQFMLAAMDPSHFPKAGPPEVAFLGRSNVGKSSLINSLLGEKLAKTSSTPGRTRSINFFSVRRAGRSQPELLFADLPGYGYAKISKEISAEWPKFIEPYLEHREPLSLSIVLIDTNVPPQEKDRQLIEWLKFRNRPFVVVGTKVDRVSNNVLNNSMRTLKGAFGIEEILPYSTKTGTGRNELWRKIGSACGMGE